MTFMYTGRVKEDLCLAEMDMRIRSLTAKCNMFGFCIVCFCYFV